MAALLNIAIAKWVFPLVGKEMDPTYAPFNAISVLLQVTPSCAALLCLIPVFVWGRSVAKVITFGLALLPTLTMISGFGEAYSLWHASR